MQVYFAIEKYRFVDIQKQTIIDLFCGINALRNNMRHKFWHISSQTSVFNTFRVLTVFRARARVPDPDPELVF